MLTSVAAGTGRDSPLADVVMPIDQYPPIPTMAATEFQVKSLSAQDRPASERDGGSGVICRASLTRIHP